MKSGRSIQDFAAEVKRRSQNKVDLVVPAQYLKMEAIKDEHDKPGVQFAVRAPRPMYAQDGSPIPNVFEVNDNAHSQIATYTGVPLAYYKRCLAEDPELLAEQVNRWLKDHENENRLLRTLDGTARALLSNVYRQLENEDLLNAVLPVIGRLGLDLMACEITERRLYIKVVDPSVTRELAQVGGVFGDGKHKIIRKVAPAVTISNSEVGQGQLSVLGGVYDGWCSNLASFGERSAKRRHVGARHELVTDELYSQFSPETRRLSDQAIWAQLKETVKIAFDEAKFDSLVKKIEGTQANRIEGDTVEVVKLTAQKFGMNDGERKSVLDHLIEGGSLTQFGLHNAITRASQDLESFDRATEFESIGGKIIDLGKGEWKALSNAVALKEAA